MNPSDAQAMAEGLMRDHGLVVTRGDNVILTRAGRLLANDISTRLR